MSIELHFLSPSEYGLQSMHVHRTSGLTICACEVR
jgi:hypothetical protein